jgi:hypothetical protein
MFCANRVKEKTDSSAVNSDFISRFLVGINLVIS